MNLGVDVGVYPSMLRARLNSSMAAVYPSMLLARLNSSMAAWVRRNPSPVGISRTGRAGSYYLPRR